MLKGALPFFLISIAAGLLGFTNLAVGARTIARWLFFIAIAVFVLSLVLGVLAGEALQHLAR